MRITLLMVFAMLISFQLSATNTNRVYLKTCKTHGTNQDTQIFTRCVNNNFKTISQAVSGINLNNCPVSPFMSQSVENCHNSNFIKLEYDLNIELSRCHNSGSGVSIGYEICVKRNFRYIEHSINNRL